MTYFPWDPALETGQPQIDTQHRSLFALAEELHDAALDPEEDPEVVTDAIYRLSEYVIQHFADEETLMQDSAYPPFAPHQALHHHLTGQTMRIASRFFNGEALAAAEIAPFLTGWLRDHIEAEDLRFAGYLHERKTE